MARLSGGVTGAGGGRAVHRLLEHLARLEGEHAAARDDDLLAGLRVAALARALLVHDEVAEAGDLDLLSALEAELHQLEDRLHHLRRLLLREADLLVDAFHDIGLRHGHRGGAPSGTELEREAPRQTLEDRRMQGVHLLVGQRPVGGAIGDGVGQALLPRRDRCAAIAVEQAHQLDVRILQRPDLLEDVTGPKGLVDHHGEVTGDGGESRQRPQCEAARNIVSEFREVKLGHPHFPWKISGLRDRGVEGAGHPEGRAAELDERRLAGMERVDLPRRPPANPLPVQAERREEAAEDALQVEEVDRRPAALDPAWRPGTGQQQRDRARLLAGAVGVEAVALAELEGADEGGPQRQVQAERGVRQVAPSARRLRAISPRASRVPRSATTRRGRSRMVGGASAFVPGASSTMPGATRPPAVRAISAATASRASGTIAGSTRRSKRYAACDGSARRRLVRRTLAGAKKALSRRSTRVADVTSEASPPITPASATGPRPSAVTRSSGSSTRSTPSSVVSRSPAAPRRTTMRRSTSRSRSKACSGWPRSSIT